MHDRLISPTLSDNEARTRSLIAREVVNRRVPALAAPDDVAELSLRPLSRAAAPLPFSDPHWLAFEWAGAQGVVEIPATAIAALLRGMLGGAMPATLSVAWREAAIVRAAGMLLKALGDTGRGQARLVAHGPTRGAEKLPRHAFALTLRYPASGEAVYGRLHLDGLGLLLAGGVVAHLPRLSAAQAWLAVPVPAQLTLGTTVLDAARLRTVVPGDVLLVTHRFSEDRSQVLLHVQLSGAAKGALVRIEGDRLTVIDSMRTIMSDTIPPSHDAGESGWDHLPIRLTFDLGEMTLALHELQRLQPGETLALGLALDGCVTIRANGAVIGAGDLVEIDGRLGVSVAWLDPAAPEAGDADTEAEADADAEGDAWSLSDDEA